MIRIWLLAAVFLMSTSLITACGDDDDSDAGSDGDADADEEEDADKDYTCTVDYCDDLITYCEWLKEKKCSSSSSPTVQGCIDQLIINFGYCGYPANIASCYADCSDESDTCSELDDCYDDHDCGWFGDCP